MSPASILYRRDLPRHQHRVSRRPVAAAHQGVALEESAGGRVIDCAGQGSLFLADTRVGDVAGAKDLSHNFATQLDDDSSPLCLKLGRVYDESALLPDDLIFMDIETTGLSSSPLFLIGVMIWEDDAFVVRQFFARNYAEEAAVVASFLEVCGSKKLLVTFNGKSFDFPYIRARATVNGLPFSLTPAHFDLLHESRRVWKHVLPDCKLQTLERDVCGRIRSGDIPGGEIPDAYHTYVRTNDAWEMVEALKHNMLDLVTLADIMTRFPDS